METPAQSRPTQIMLDLETLGNVPGSIIVAIGAVKFDESGILDRYYQRVDPASCEAIGLKMDVSTVLFWMKQDNAARLELTLPGLPLLHVLTAFAQWIGDREAEIWGNGPSFDNAMLAAAYRIAGMRTPWKFKNERCYRTAQQFHPQIPQLPREGTHHNALDDAENQALHLLQILQEARKRTLSAENDTLTLDSI